MPKSIFDGAREACDGRGLRRCRNKCFFCYVKGLPGGLRNSLYIRDDDLQQSFIYGSFVTLTNLTDKDWRLLEQRRLSPLRVSVHATDLALRRRMLGNPQAPDILEQLKRLGSMGIRVHVQVVLCPGVNDGPHLEKTIEDLAALVGAGLKPAPTPVTPAPALTANKPARAATLDEAAPTTIANEPARIAMLDEAAPIPVVESVALVPIGMSMRLEDSLASHPGPWPLARYTPEQSLALVKWALPYQEEFRRTTGKTFLHLSDEIYLLARWPLPEASQYDGFPQYQNGVGMVRTLLDDWERFENKTKARMDDGWQPDPRRLVALCGTLIAPVLEDLGRRLTGVTGREFVVVPVVNSLLGPMVTVSGLLPGRDFASALPPLKDGDVVLVPRRAVEASGKFFLDNLSVQRLRRMALPGKLFLVERPVDLNRALWGNQGAVGKGALCAA